MNRSNTSPYEIVQTVKPLSLGRMLCGIGQLFVVFFSLGITVFCLWMMRP